MQRLLKIDSIEYRRQLRRKLFNCLSIFSNQKVNGGILCKALNDKFKNSFERVKFSELSMKSCKGTDFVIIGYYDSDLDQFKTKYSIKIFLTEYTKHKKYISRKRIEEIVYTLSDCIIHELLHKRQTRKRNFLDNCVKTVQNFETVVYLADPDEIQSYSHNIASELIDNYSIDEIKLLLTNLKNLGISQHLDLYNKYFIGTDDAHFLKKLYKSVYKYTLKLEPKLINKI